MSLLPITRRRLEKIAAHLESGNLAHAQFDFASLNEGPYDKRGCGTAGCAMGEFPVIFPRLCAFTAVAAGVCVHMRGPAGTSVIDNLLGNGPLSDIPLLPGIGALGIRHLFWPSFDRAAWNKHPLSENATPKQVARGIRNYIKWKDTWNDTP